MPEPIAIAISDLHLSLTQPACRADKDWMAVQAGYLKQVRDLAKQLGDVPVLCAGDIFDKWNAPAELINFALEHLPDGMICVPGQHDLPEHRMEGMHRSGYGVLKRTNKIRNIANQTTGNMGGFLISGFGWGQELRPAMMTQLLKIALVHKYIWRANAKYPGADALSNVNCFENVFGTYDFVISGDNHKGWVGKAGKCNVINPGTFIRRKSDEINHLPCIAVLFSDGSFKRHLLNIGEDKFHEGVKDRPEVPINMREFINQLESLGEHGLNFREEVKRYLEEHEVTEGTRQIIMSTMQ